MKFQDWLNNNQLKEHCESGWRKYECIVCNDGFSMSVQAFDGAYCHPRWLLNDANEYTHFEVGFPSEKPSFFFERADDCNNPTETVYGYVSAELIQQEIDLHGGIKND